VTLPTAALSHLQLYLLSWPGLAFLLCLPGLMLAPSFGHWPPAQRLLAVLVLGPGVWIAALFSLAASQLLHLAAVLALAVTFLIGALLATRVELAARRSSSSATLAEPASRAPADFPAAPGDLRGTPRVPSRAHWLLLPPLLALLGALFVRATSPALAWDANVYHLTLPRLYLEHGGFRPVEMSAYANWPLAVELLFALGMLVGDYVLAKLVHFTLGLFLLLAMWVTLRSERGVFAAGLGVALLMINPVVLDQWPVAYVDIALALFVYCGFALTWRAARTHERARGVLLLAGVSCGLAAGTKLTGALAVPCLGALYVLHAARARGLSRALGDAGMLLAAPALALAAPWYLKSALYTGNPVYPLLHGVFGGPDWSAELGRQLMAWQRGIGFGREPLDYLLLPVRVVLQGGPGYDRFDGALHPAWLLLVPLAFWLGRRDPLVRGSLLVAGLWFVAWAAGSQQMRLLIPALPLLATAAAVALQEGIGRLRAPRARVWLGGGVASLAAVLVVAAAMPVVAGAARLLPHVLQPGEVVRRQAVLPIYRFMETLPPDARILFLDTNFGFFAPREYLADSFFEASQVAALLRQAADAGELRALLHSRGVTHLLWHRADWGIDYPPALHELLRDDSRSRLVYRDARNLLFELLPPSP
jgi:4-amino-4-deoxy-L-arabinose transferase-like glycosyltransferase